MKLVIGDSKSGKSFQAEVQKDHESLLIGKKIGDEIDGSQFGAAGYTLQISGGTDIAGFPMRKDVDGPRRKKLLLASGPGFRQKQKGERAKKVIRGNIISDEIQQVNFKVKTAGPKPLGELFAKKEGEKKE
ncbi:MAG: 30S ribosomal protein S6e [Candidatus Micrarchaeota archaeon]